MSHLTETPSSDKKRATFKLFKNETSLQKLIGKPGHTEEKKHRELVDKENLIPHKDHAKSNPYFQPPIMSLPPPEI